MSPSPLPRAAEAAQLAEIAVTPAAEAAWVERVCRGEPAAVDWMVRSHWERVQRLILRMGGARQDLEDLVQTTFLETLRALPSFRRESALATFISGIAVRVVLRARRPSKVARSALPLERAGELESVQPGPDVEYERSEALQRLHTILERISEPKRVAFLLWAVEGIAVEEVARAMSASLSATRSRIFYAQKAIKAAVGRDPWLRHWLEEGARS